MYARTHTHTDYVHMSSSVFCQVECNGGFAPFLTDATSTFHTHIHSEGCICIKYFNYGGHAEVMHINSVWKWIYFINGISSEGQRSANGVWIETPHLFLTVVPLAARVIFYLFSSHLSLSVIPSESCLQGLGR